MPHDLRESRCIVERRDPASGRWLVVEHDRARLQVTVGSTGNRLSTDHRRRRLTWQIAVIAGQLEVLALWPVREVLTEQIGCVIDDLADDLRHAGGDHSDLDRIREAVAGLFGRDRTDDPLAMVLWAAAFPLLGSVDPIGAGLRTVPRVLGPLLRADTPRAGARALYGRVTRPLVRTVARRLAGDGAGSVFDPLVIAAMAVGTCSPEQLTSIIGTDPARPGAVAFSVADVNRARCAFADQPPRRVTATLQAALSQPDGLHDLADRLRSWAPVRPDPTPAPLPMAPRRRGRTPAPAVATAAPATDDPSSQRISHPATWRAARDQHILGHTVILPRTGDDLLQWGRALDNCLGTFRYAATSGRSRILGLTCDGTLRYAVEVTPGGTIRQIEGRGNQQPDERLGDDIAREVIRLGLADCDGRTGRSLVAPPARRTVRGRTPTSAR